MTKHTHPRTTLGSEQYGATLPGRDAATGYEWTGEFACCEHDPNRITVKLPPRADVDANKFATLLDSLDDRDDVVSWCVTDRQLRVRVSTTIWLSVIGDDLARMVADTRLGPRRLRINRWRRAVASVFRRMADWLSPHDAV